MVVVALNCEKCGHRFYTARGDAVGETCPECSGRLKEVPLHEESPGGGRFRRADLPEWHVRAIDSASPRFSRQSSVSLS